MTYLRARRRARAQKEAVDAERDLSAGGFDQYKNSLVDFQPRRRDPGTRRRSPANARGSSGTDRQLGLIQVYPRLSAAAGRFAASRGRLPCRRRWLCRRRYCRRQSSMPADRDSVSRLAEVRDERRGLSPPEMHDRVRPLERHCVPCPRLCVGMRRTFTFVRYAERDVPTHAHAKRATVNTLASLYWWRVGRRLSIRQRQREAFGDLIWAFETNGRGTDGAAGDRDVD